MAEFKIVVGDSKTGKSYQKAIAEDACIGMKIGDKVNGDLIGLPEYELQIAGGSDSAGFPMRSDILGAVRKRPLVTGGVGVKISFRKNKEKGLRIRKTVCGNTIGPKTAQINLKVLKFGSKPIPELWGIAPEEKKEA